MAEHWGVALPQLTESDASELATFALNGLGLRFAYSFDHREWLSWGLDHESVRTLANALRLSGLTDDCASGLLESLDEWLQAYESRQGEQTT